MKHFEIREAAKLLDLPEERIRSCMRAGFLSPRHDPQGEVQLTFQDLLVLKTSKGLLDSGVTSRRIARLMDSLRRQLGAGSALSSLTIYADGRHVVVWDGTQRWEPDSGQFVLDLDAAPPASPLQSPATVAELESAVATAEEAPGASDVAIESRPVGKRGFVVYAFPADRVRGRSAEAPALSAEQWFDLGCELEGESREEARRAYHRALERDPKLADAHINLGRQYHETKELAEAEAHYRAAAEHAPDDPIVWFNLGVLLEDLRRPHEAIHAYRQAIARDGEYADAHYNLGLLLESLGRKSEAMTHLMTARKLYGWTREP